MESDGFKIHDYSKVKRKTNSVSNMYKITNNLILLDLKMVFSFKASQPVPVLLAEALWWINYKYMKL